FQRMVESALYANHSNRSSRAGTLEHKSRASTASTIKEVQPTILDDATMESIFNSITLPDVEFSHKQAEMSVLDHFDTALANESSQSYRSSVSEVPSPVPSSLAGHVVAEIVAHRVAEHVIKEAIIDHAIHQHEREREALHELARLKIEQEAMERERERAAELMAELEDQFEENMTNASRRSSVYSHRSFGNLSPRHRSMTVDSLASLAESRFGQIDIHDDNDEYTAEELDLHHNEVAYQRVKKPKTFSAPIPPLARRPNEEDVLQLEAFNHKLTQARQEIAFLEARIAEHEALRAHRAASIASHRHSYHGSTHHDKWASEVDAIYEEDVGVSPLARHQIEHGTELARVGNRTLIIPAMHRVESFSTQSIHKYIIGGEAEPHADDKTVLLFGPKGSGKSSLINSMLNFLYDVKRENKFRFVVSNGIEATKGVNVYVFNNTILPFSVTIVDTPGVSNEKTKGSEPTDKTCSTLIKTWFEKELISNGKFRLDAISVVLRNAESRLEWPFIHELAAIKRMFGDDLKTNVLPIITNTEVLPQPVAVRALASANIAFLQYYKVNNAGFFPEAVEDMTKLKHNLFYRAGIASLETYFKDLQELIHPLVAVLRSKAAFASLGDASLY
ncbi:hypothetical protein PRIPAC_95722, partial [Pristionchus pacificus]